MPFTNLFISMDTYLADTVENISIIYMSCLDLRFSTIFTSVVPVNNIYSVSVNKARFI